MEFATRKKPLLFVGALGALGLCLLFVGGSWLAAERAAARERQVFEAPYDALATARASNGKIPHREAGIPPQCYTKTEGTSNPCWTCHTSAHHPNDMADWTLQVAYAFSEEGSTNHWTNLFEDRSAKMAELSDAEVLAYVQTDNYRALRRSLSGVKDFPGYQPDLDFSQGFDEGGFARDGSGWRALRYKPFPGTFWPTNGSTDDVFIRLPKEFRSLGGKLDRATYVKNLELLERSIASNPTLSDASLGLPLHYAGDAAPVALFRGLFPEGTEFLHSVRYLDPDAPSFTAARMKELRYSQKVAFKHPSQLMAVYAGEHDERDEGLLPVYQGDAISGVRNDHGWRYQGYIEDERGRLRLQTHQEHLACMGCHSNIGVTVDGSFAFARKVPGDAGWAYQDLRGMKDVPQLGHVDPEVLTYVQRVGAGDEFRVGDEFIERFVPDGRVDTAALRRAAPGGDRDLAWLLTPSRERALDLNRAYMALVREQDFEHGRDAPLAPPKNVLARIEEESTGLAEKNRVYQDGRLHLAWPE